MHEEPIKQHTVCNAYADATVAPMMSQAAAVILTSSHIAEQSIVLLPTHHNPGVLRVLHNPGILIALI